MQVQLRAEFEADPLVVPGSARVVLSFSDLGTKGNIDNDVPAVQHFVDLSVRSGVSKVAFH